MPKFTQMLSDRAKKTRVLLCTQVYVCEHKGTRWRWQRRLWGRDISLFLGSFIYVSTPHNSKKLSSCVYNKRCAIIVEDQNIKDQNS